MTSLVIPYDVRPEPIQSKTPDLKAKSPDPGKQSKTQPADTQPTSAPSETDTRAQLNVDELIDKIAMTLAPELEGTDTMDQKNVDRILM